MKLVLFICNAIVIAMIITCCQFVSRVNAMAKAGLALRKAAQAAKHAKGAHTVENMRKFMTATEVENMMSNSVGGRHPSGSTPAIFIDTDNKPKRKPYKISPQMKAKHTDKVMRTNHTQLFQSILGDIG